MSSAKSTAALTMEGVPLDQKLSAVSPTAASDDGLVMRRIAGTAPRLAPARPRGPAADKGPAPSGGRAVPRKLLRPGPARGSLIDDDDDELVEYFGGGGVAKELTRQMVPAPDEDLASSSRWDVLDRDVPALPSFYPLEKSSVVVVPAPARAVATRVAAALEARSIAATYDGRNAKADCLSGSGVEFRVRLYRGRRGVIVEVQRRAGFALDFIQDVYAILDAAEGKPLEGACVPCLPE